MPKEPWSHTGRFTKGKQPGRVRKTMERSAAALQTLCSTEKRIPDAYSVRMRRKLPKEKLLMYAGDFSEGDDTEAFLGLAENLDFQKYDVTLLVCGGGDDFAEEQIIGLPAGLRILYRGQPF